MKMTPEVAPLGSFALVALSQFSSNTLLTDAQDDADVTDGHWRVRAPVPQRRRTTARLRTDVSGHYQSGMSSRRVANALGLGRTTVLEILKAADVKVWPRGRRY